MSKIVDEVWTENPGVMLRVTDNGGFMLLEFVENIGAGIGNSVIYSAEVTKYRWERLIQEKSK